MKDREKKISKGLLSWSQKHPRSLPWKSDRDPYKIWISEIILQQTRVVQGTPYFLKFIEAFPTVKTLADAKLDAVYKVWEGLGYYRRAKHLHEAAMSIMEKHDGIFPSCYKDILALKGVGPYTAAAVASFAYDLPYPVIDGNVSRVIARLFAIEEEIDGSEGKKKISGFVHEVFASRHAAAFNQAIMDFGATHCTPSNPGCQNCNLARQCEAYLSNKVAELPRKKPKRSRRERHFFYIIINEGGDLWIKKRTEADVWQNLYEFFLLDADQPIEWSEAHLLLPLPVQLISISDIYQQTLTHQKIYATFAEVLSSSKGRQSPLKGFNKIKRKDLRNFAFPKIIDCYLGDKAVNLSLAF